MLSRSHQYQLYDQSSKTQVIIVFVYQAPDADLFPVLR